jgi:hypothetical protein
LRLKFVKNYFSNFDVKTEKVSYASEAQVKMEHHLLARYHY